MSSGAMMRQPMHGKDVKVYIDQEKGIKVYPLLGVDVNVYYPYSVIPGMMSTHEGSDPVHPHFFHMRLRSPGASGNPEVVFMPDNNIILGRPRSMSVEVNPSGTYKITVRDPTEKEFENQTKEYTL